ncbi:ALP1-like protein [Tanacetum coccineum]|uniref:ALP1-like protein n=1 Tax=Tanacetum coccineum TaxID=301880 RepID=A0ABQ5ABJ4_9ASTR
MGGSSSQPRTVPAMSPINAFLIEDLYTPEFSESLQENTGYWQEPNPHEYPTIEEEIMLAKGWVAIFENSEHGNARKKDGFWGEVLVYIVTKRKRTAESGAGDEDYVQRVMIHYQAETGLPFKFRHCWDVLKDSLKWKEIALLNFNTGFEGGSKRHKSSGSSSFNTESEDASINLNTNVVDEDEDQKEEGGPQCLETERLQLRSINNTRRIGSISAIDHLTGDQRMAMDEAREKIKAKYNLQY